MFLGMRFIVSIGHVRDSSLRCITFLDIFFLGVVPIV